MLDLLLMIRTARGNAQETPWVDAVAFRPEVAQWLAEHAQPLPHHAPRQTLAGPAPVRSLVGANWTTGSGRAAGETLFLTQAPPDDLVPALLDDLLAYDRRVTRGITAVTVCKVNRPIETYLPGMSARGPACFMDLTDADLTPVVSLYQRAKPEVVPQKRKLTKLRTPPRFGR